MQIITNNLLSILYGRSCAVNAASKWAEAMLVRKRDLYESDIKLDDLTSEQHRQVREKYGHVVTTTLIDSLPAVTANEHVVTTYHPLKNGIKHTDNIRATGKERKLNLKGKYTRHE